MTAQERLRIEQEIVRALRGVYDPEIPVNIYDLGLIYEINLSDDGATRTVMTLTAPNCPMADMLLEEVERSVATVEGVTASTVELIFEPPWDKEMLSEEAKLELGLL
jgi:FeS assembly SUF system protein